MTSMIERVARAIYDVDPAGNSYSFDEYKDDWINMARAAIEAMREPTEAMVKAHHVVPDDNDFTERAESNLRAVMAAALAESEHIG